MKDIESLEKIVEMHRTSRDYCSDYFASRDLANKIMRYWHNKGYKSVKVWVEKVDLASGKNRWDIRGNIVFNCKNINKDL